MSVRKRSAAAVVLLAMAAALTVALPQTDADATSYRFWIYWTGGSGDWDFASQGASRRPADGSVEGWRFAISEEASSSATPRLSSSFQQICGSTQPVEGKKRVGLVIDFGTDADAPAGQTPPNGPVARCVVAPTTASGYEILASVTSLRVDAGMICGVAGYPTSGCGEPVKSPKPTKDPQPNPSGTNPGGTSTPAGNPQNTNTNANNNGGGGSDAGGGANKSDGPNGNKSDLKEEEAGSEADESTPTEQESSDAAIAAASTSTLPTTNSGSPIGALVGAAIVAALVAAAIWLTRRRRTKT